MNKENDILQNSVDLLVGRAAELKTPDGLVEETVAILKAVEKTTGDKKRQRIVSFAIAACIAIACFVGIYVWNISFDGTSVAWAKVSDMTADISLLHFYEYDYENDQVSSSRQGWYSNGNLFYRKSNDNVIVDNGLEELEYNLQGEIINRKKSVLGNDLGMYENESFFKRLTLGVFKYDNEQVQNKKATHIGKDFLLYNFDMPTELSDDIESVTIVVGKNSKLPVQMKIFYKGSADNYSMFIFEYDLAELPESLNQFIKLN